MSKPCDTEQQHIDQIKLLSDIIQNAAPPMFVIDADHKIIFWNSALAELTGRSSSKMIGTRLKWSAFYPSERPVLADIVMEHQDGSVRDEGWYDNFGGKRRYIVFEATPVKNSGGETVAIVETLVDITDQKSAEAELYKAYCGLKDAQAQIFQQEKMASIGQLAAGVAHEINNPMGFISSNLGTLNKYIDRLAEFIAAEDQAINASSGAMEPEKLNALRKKLKVDYILDDARQLIVESLDGASRVRRIVQDLKSFSRVDLVEKGYVNLNEALETTINIAWNEIKYVSTLNREFGEIPDIRCYPQQLNQVFLNLLVNAAHAMEGRQGSITVRTWSEDDSVFVSVADTGCGIPEDILDHIFEPFFTTKEVGRGTGLGLSISYDIVRKHGGEITVVSEAGRGTTFTVRLPVEGAGIDHE